TAARTRIRARTTTITAMAATLHTAPTTGHQTHTRTTGTTGHITATLHTEARTTPMAPPPTIRALLATATMAIPAATATVTAMATDMATETAPTTAASPADRLSASDRAAFV